MGSPVEAASNVFESYAHLNDPLLPVNHMSSTQIKLARWQARNFGSATLQDLALGVCEEAGELAHAVLKHLQGIRGLKDPQIAKIKIADALADVCIYATQIATLLRIDFGENYIATVEQVLERDWKTNQENGENQ